MDVAITVAYIEEQEKAIANTVMNMGEAKQAILDYFRIGNEFTRSNVDLVNAFDSDWTIIKMINTSTHNYGLVSITRDCTVKTRTPVGKIRLEINDATVYYRDDVAMVCGTIKDSGVFLFFILDRKNKFPEVTYNARD